jgi:hypothetical protein
VCKELFIQRIIYRLQVFMLQVEFGIYKFGLVCEGFMLQDEIGGGKIWTGSVYLKLVDV